jgi:hypothetical protein
MVVSEKRDDTLLITLQMNASCPGFSRHLGGADDERQKPFNSSMQMDLFVKVLSDSSAAAFVGTPRNRICRCLAV